MEGVTVSSVCFYLSFRIDSRAERRSAYLDSERRIIVGDMVSLSRNHTKHQVYTEYVQSKLGLASDSWLYPIIRENSVPFDP